ADWLRSHRPNWRALMNGLKKGGYRLTIQARLLGLLFAPDFTLVPSTILVDPKFHYGITEQTYLDLGHDGCFRGLDPELLPFLTELLCDGHDYNVARFHRATSTHNVFFIELLGVLPEELGEEVFARCRWLSLEPYHDDTSTSGYHGYGELMGNANVPVSFKERATTVMREIVNSEVSGLTKPRAIWEAAAPAFTHELLMNLYQKPSLPFPSSLLRRELLFLFSLPPEAKVRISKAYWEKLMQLFSRDTPEHRDFRIALARNFFLNPPEYGNGHQFVSETQVILAKRTLGDLGDSEPEISAIIQDAVTRSEQNVAKLTEDTRRWQQTEDALR
ncbi:hypothetical protein KBA73_05605, partial [Patescibacteria group bacterium]|nr:hypothetical protein [Patescibacteria group bacterium]